MRGIVSTLLILVMLMQTFSKTIIFTSFKINQDYIAKNLCENRGTPEKHCCGKCLLRKQMQRDEQKQDSGLPSSLKNLDHIVLMCEVPLGDNLTSYFNQEILFSNPAQKFNSPLRDGIFHPPTVC